LHGTIIYFASGLILGLAAGISPGPLLALVISETIKHGKKEGIKLALVPLITDLPIVLVSILFISQFSGYNYILGVISLLGAIFIIYLAWENIRYNPVHLNLSKKNPKSLLKGMIANFLSPHPYLFWILIGAPAVVRAWQLNTISAIAFIFAFYFFLTGSKVFIAMLADRLKNILKDKVFVWSLRIIGIVLLVVAVLLIINGIKYVNKV
jgi:threonine/homoserine/homoserine lactone efflux protein